MTSHWRMRPRTHWLQSLNNPLVVDEKTNKEFVMIRAHGYAVQEPGAPLAPWEFERREPGPNDVQIEIVYTGVCHTDLHQATNHWGGGFFPMVPGHEIVGLVSAVGEHVTKLRPGDFAGVGFLVDSDQQCLDCKEDHEQFCQAAVQTFNSWDPDAGQPTYGGYSDVIVVDEQFAVHIPDTADLAGTAPLLCAGITMYSPLRHWNVGPGDRVGVIGLGGLGHIGVKLAKALGADVSVITTSPAKSEDALRLGADHVLISRDADAMAAAADSFDLLLDTIPTRHDANPYLPLLKHDKTLVLVGALELLDPVDGNLLIFGRKNLSGTVIGGMAETQEMIDFCARHGIVSDIEVIAMQDINEAYRRLERNDVRYRFVIDMSTLREAA
jgi:alcohol dehydrogenase (NADP+)